MADLGIKKIYDKFSYLFGKGRKYPFFYNISICTDLYKTSKGNFSRQERVNHITKLVKGHCLVNIQTWQLKNIFAHILLSSTLGSKRRYQQVSTAAPYLY